MKIFAFIFARGGSKGLPRKNIKLLNDIPLLAYSIKVAQEINEIERVFVSTDDREISKIALDYGAEVIQRPYELAQDDSPERDSWRHAIKYLDEKGEKFDVFLSLPATSPLRNSLDVTTCLEMFDDNSDFVVSVTESSRSPFFNMVSEKNGYVKLLMEDEAKPMRRQDAPVNYDMTTVAYVSRPKFILNNNRIFDGRVKAYKVPKIRSIDIDSNYDFSIAEMLINKGVV